MLHHPDAVVHSFSALRRGIRQLAALHGSYRRNHEVSGRFRSRSPSSGDASACPRRRTAMSVVEAFVGDEAAVSSLEPEAPPSKRLPGLDLGEIDLPKLARLYETL